MLEEIGLLEARETLTHLAQAFLAGDPAKLPGSALILERTRERKPGGGPDLEAKYKALAEQIPAVIFVAPLDTDGLSEAYVSPQIETILAFTQEEWLADPLLWYQRVHAEDKNRCSVEAASLFLSGTPLRSVYRVLARDGRVVWFQCEAKMVRREDGRPWFIHGIGFDCGPATFLNTFTSGLREWGVEPQRIHSETFGPAASSAPNVISEPRKRSGLSRPAQGSGPQIAFVRSGVTVSWDQQFSSLLELAEAFDIPVRWSCRTGVCHTCECSIVGGDVDYSPAPVEPPAAGNVLICCARPKTDLQLDL